MRNASALVLGLAAVVGADAVRAQDLSPKAVRRLLERRRPLTFVPGEIIVKMKAGVAAAAAMPADKLSRLGIGPETRATSGGELVYRLQPAVLAALSREAAAQRTMAAVEAMGADPGVEYAQPNFILHVVSTTPNDPDFRRQWHYFEHGSGAGRSRGGINLPREWDANKGSASVVVAVLDTGILPDHPDIAGSPNLVAGYDMITSVRTANDGDGRDPDPSDPGDGTTAGECGPGSPTLPDSWHGTHVAGTVGAGRTDNGRGVAGVNWSSRVQAVRVLGKCGGTIEDINDAIRWAAGLPVPGVPANATPARVANMSLGGSGACSVSPSTQRAIDDAVGAGTTVVVAAGNDASDAASFLPASCDGVITVAASDGRGRLVQRYSNFGATVEIMAPGGDVERDDDGDGNDDGVYSMVRGGYAYYNGTSMATPHVAGVAALVLAANPGATPAQVLARIQQTAIPRTSEECPRPCGAGLLNAFAGFVSIAFAPPEIKLDDAGQSADLTATIQRGSAPVAGARVELRSENPAVAMVDPASAVTDGEGRVRVRVEARSKGRTSVQAEAEGGANTAPVRVPDLSDTSLVVLAALIVVLFRRRTRVRAGGA